MDELGLLESLLAVPHQKTEQLRAQVGDAAITVADFRSLSPRWGFIAMMPQWDFLDFLAAQGRRYRGFELRMRAAAKALIEEDGRVCGVVADTADGPLEVRARLTMGCDGRHSLVRTQAGLVVENFGAPMDVLWFALPRHAGDTDETVGRFDAGRIFIMINRTDHWQCGFVIPKGSFDEIRAKGLEAFRAELATLAPLLGDRTEKIADWDEVKLLTVSVDRLKQWARPGLLCIGDAAHTMSPIGGVGINLAIQDAVAAANILAAKLRIGTVTLADLDGVQRRRAFPTRVIQSGQVLIQRRIIRRVLASSAPITPPLVMKLMQRVPALRRIPARIIGIGVRPEHVRTGEAG
jgi:2-polyprenyl-6-methoxyphenol hydroxylase-like FAD-dependent oxidoreductase